MTEEEIRSALKDYAALVGDNKKEPVKTLEIVAGVPPGKTTPETIVSVFADGKLVLRMPYLHLLVASRYMYMSLLEMGKHLSLPDQ